MVAVTKDGFSLREEAKVGRRTSLQNSSTKDVTSGGNTSPLEFSTVSDMELRRSVRNENDCQKRRLELNFKLHITYYAISIS